MATTYPFFCLVANEESAINVMNQVFGGDQSETFDPGNRFEGLDENDQPQEWLGANGGFTASQFIHFESLNTAGVPIEIGNPGENLYACADRLGRTWIQPPDEEEEGE